jgi:CYTH domain-containing protein
MIVSQMIDALSQDHGKYARLERERRFLLRELPPGLSRQSEHVQIWDNYITGTRLRLRKIRVPKTNEYVWKLTQKYASAPADFSRTMITNIYLSQYEYETLSVFNANEIRKNRYPYTDETGRVYAIDFFLGNLLGLILAETDFVTDEELENFTCPAFAVADVTNDELFTGGRLAVMTYDGLRAEMAKR